MIVSISLLFKYARQQLGSLASGSERNYMVLVSVSGAAARTPPPPPPPAASSLALPLPLGTLLGRKESADTFRYEAITPGPEPEHPIPWC